MRTIVVFLLSAMAVTTLVVWMAANDTPARPSPTQPSSIAEPVAPPVPTTLEQLRKSRREPCANIKELADRRKVADFTANDLDRIRVCKELGLW